MKSVVDASVLVRASVTEQEQHAEARAWLAGIAELVAPHLIWFEVTTAIRKMEFAGMLSREQAERDLQAALSLSVRLESPEGLFLESMALARKLKVSRTRDTAYLALALREDCPLYTLDKRFQRNASSHGYAVHLIPERNP